MTSALCRPVPRGGPDECPGALDLRAAEDGMLARARVPGGRLGPAALDGLAGAAALGNGLVDLTARANVQIRGFEQGCEDELGALLAGHGLLPSAAHDRVRNIVASPVGGRHPQARTATDDVVAALDAELCSDPGLALLPGKFLFCVDDGSGLGFARGADVALMAADEGDGFELVIAGGVRLGPVGAGEAPGAALAAARAFLVERERRGDRAWRIAELEGGPEAVGAAVSGLAGPMSPDRGAPPAPGAPLAPGQLRQRDGRIAVTALAPLGQLDADQLRGLAELGTEVRISTARTLTVVDVNAEAASDCEDALARLGLVTGADSGWFGLTACAGLGRCPRAKGDVRTAAAQRAATRGARAGAEHWTACERRCGERGSEQVTVSVGDDGVAVRTAAGSHTCASLDGALELLA